MLHVHIALIRDRPRCLPPGIQSLMDGEAVIVGGTNHSHATKVRQ